MPTTISTVRPGEKFDALFAVVSASELRQTARGKPYAAYTLRDQTGEIKLNLWDAEQILPTGTFVKVRGSGEEYNGAVQIKVDLDSHGTPLFRPVAEKDGISIDSVLPCAPEPCDAMMSEVRATVAAFADADLRALVTSLLDAAAPEMLRFPAAQAMHHAEIGGLLHHVTSMLRLAKAVAGVYPDDLNTDLLYAGVIVHDLGKMDEMQRDTTGLVSGYTTEGKLLGHIPCGILRIAEAAKALGTPPEKALLLEHLVLAHHGKPEWGSPVPARTPEAEVLATIDNLDARLFEMRAALRDTAPGSFTPRVFALENRELYKAKE